MFLELCRMWPEADVYTAVYDEQGTEGRFAGRNIHTSFLQRLRPSARTFRVLFPLYPAAIESFDFSGYDLVVSSSSAWAHAVLCDERTVHVSYCHNPSAMPGTIARPRWPAGAIPVTRAFLAGAFRRWRQWDRVAAARTDRYIANSRVTQERIRSYFGRESQVVYPPVDTDRFSPGPVGDHYVLVSELMPHKQIDVAVAAFNRLRLPLIVVGDGPAGRALRRQAGPTVSFTGRVPDVTVAEIVSGARALVMTSVEEFGIAAVESQAAGRPVIARRGGGALETVIDGVTGCFWSGARRSWPARCSPSTTARSIPRPASPTRLDSTPRVSAQESSARSRPRRRERAPPRGPASRWPRPAWSRARFRARVAERCAGPG